MPGLNRFEYERAFIGAPRSLCHPSVRHLLHALLVHLDKDAGVILPQFGPSITELAREMGTDRRSASRRIRRAIEAGWLARESPSMHDARTKHARTQYTLRYPHGYPQARGTDAQQLGAGRPVASGSDPLGLGAGQQQARGETPHRSDTQIGSPARTREIEQYAELGAIADAVRERSGKTISREQAAAVAEQITGARDNIKNRAAYCRKVIMAAPYDAYVPPEARGY